MTTSLIRISKTSPVRRADYHGGEKLTFVYNYGAPVSNGGASSTSFTLGTSTVRSSVPLDFTSTARVKTYSG